MLDEWQVEVAKHHVTVTRDVEFLATGARRACNFTKNVLTRQVEPGKKKNSGVTMVHMEELISTKLYNAVPTSLLSVCKTTSVKIRHLQPEHRETHVLPADGPGPWI